MTAVEFLMLNIFPFEKRTNEQISHIITILKQAKEMEKQQIIDAHIDGYESISGQEEQYYNETYGSKGSDELSKVEENTSFDTSSKTEMIKKAEWLLDELNKNK